MRISINLTDSRMETEQEQVIKRLELRINNLGQVYNKLAGGLLGFSAF